MSVRVFAPAKINLTLKVGRPRADGRHSLESVVAFADVGDWVLAAPDESLALELSGPFATELSAEGDNLVLRAARALAAHYGVTSGARLHLEKHLPIASGIGGGSTDAAAALKALTELWKLPATEHELSAIAATLGADVPVCVAARSAYMTGTGETTQPMQIPALHAVLINPLTPLSTGNVYAAFDAAHLGGGFRSQSAPAWASAADALAEMRELGNDLARPAEELSPIIAEILSALRAEPPVLYAALSGSGATCFAILETALDASALAVQMKHRWPAFWVVPARLS
jgi:4-diphosphocytidyl-2-C-methyl-D-erythritol kinase